MIWIIGFTGLGIRLAAEIKTGLQEAGYPAEAYSIGQKPRLFEKAYTEGSLSDWTKAAFREADGLVFVGACGIAVRSIAPFIRDKRRDPGVVAVDELGKYAVSLLSSHLGGGNELAALVAKVTRGTPVLLTATDLRGSFAADLFAKKNDLVIRELKLLKRISAAVLRGEKVGFASDYPAEGRLPKELCLNEPCSSGIWVSINEVGECPYPQTLHLVPRIVTAGIGCKKGTEYRMIIEELQQAFREAGICAEALCRIASICLKQEETGLIEAARLLQVPFVTYKAEKLRRLSGDYTASEFVTQVTGVDNVCERSAVLGSKGGELVVKKRAGNGVTVALAVSEWRVNFE